MSQHQRLSRSAILDAPDLAIEEVLVPEWPVDGNPGLVCIHQLNSEDTMLLTKEMAKQENEEDGMFIILVRTARDEQGQPLFTMEDVPALRKKSMRVLNRLQRIAIKVNALDAMSEVAAKKD